MSKAWLAALILRLAGEGRMRLDDTVARWLPGVLPYGRRITVRTLLDDTSGMVDSNDIDHDLRRFLREVRDPGLRARLTAVADRVIVDPAYQFSPRLWVEFAAALPLEYPPGTTYHYSNIGYDVAGFIAERAGGADLETLLRREIIDPLRLASAAYDRHARIQRAPRAGIPCRRRREAHRHDHLDGGNRGRPAAWSPTRPTRPTFSRR